MNKHKSTKPHVLVGTIGPHDHAGSVVIDAAVLAGVDGFSLTWRPADALGDFAEPENTNEEE